ncbi:hypothetical protein FQA39_LY14590 [Lamprigera yunnana]|nr:hypothetical protein FQA39_LY14590 [Lamprigera yunnana]
MGYVDNGYKTGNKRDETDSKNINGQCTQSGTTVEPRQVQSNDTRRRAQRWNVRTDTGNKNFKIVDAFFLSGSKNNREIMGSNGDVYFYRVLKFFAKEQKKTKNESRNLTSYLLLSFFSVFKKLYPYSEKVNKSNRYWSRQSVPEIIEDADHLFVCEKYVEVYELLNRLKFSGDAQIHWRLCRALFKMSSNQGFSKDICREMIMEAYDVMKIAVEVDPNNGNVHKWLAIIMDARAGLEGVGARIKSYEAVKEHLLKAVELNPNDVAVYYMLGRWCFQISNISWLQRKISSLLFCSCPTSTYEEAYDYFMRAEELQPKFYLPNLYMLGCTSLHLNQIFRAKYYLSVASELRPRNAYETEFAAAAYRLKKTLVDIENSILHDN